MPRAAVVAEPVRRWLQAIDDLAPNADPNAALEPLLAWRRDAALPPSLAELYSQLPLSPTVLAGVYEQLLARHGGRRDTGSFFTPPVLVNLLVENSLAPLVSRRLVAAARAAGLSSANAIGGDRVPAETPPLHQWNDVQRQAAEAALLALRVCDPACGPGPFLAAVGALLVNHLLLLRVQKHDDALDRGMAWSDVLRHCLFGIDSDDGAIAVARLALWLAAGRPTSAGAPCPDLRAGDSLFDLIDQPARFDAVIGNPPFANAIEGQVSEQLKQHLSATFPELIGTADLAFYFLALADRLARPDGAVALILPRNVLTARAAASLRARLLRERPPVFIFAPPEQHLFAGANVYIALVALAQAGGPCVGGLGSASDPQIDRVTVTDDHWWSPLLGQTTIAKGPPRRKVGDRFEAIASMTAGMAYDIQPYISDEPRKGALRFVTTGLIDPGVCRWGVKRCRYLKRDFARPLVHEQPTMPATLRQRLADVRRPKVLVAGLSNRVEAIVDREGGYCGAVSTFAVFHPTDDLHELERLADFLNGPVATAALHRQLGAAAMGGGRITLSKAFLAGLEYE